MKTLKIVFIVLQLLFDIFVIEELIVLQPKDPEIYV